MTKISIDSGRSAGTLPHFWRATGFSPAQLLLTHEMRATLGLVSGTPRQEVEYMRPHYMLDLIRASRSGAKIQYDWSLFDKAVDTMVEFGFKPIFEIMGNPSDVFTNFDEKDEILLWRDMIAEMTGRFIGRYGKEEVRSWYFETWNEPDIWWKFSDRGFANYYDACVDGIDAVDPTLTIGGPGTARTLAPMFKLFVAHCDTGTSCITGDGPPRCDFISIHEKGVRDNLEDVTPNTLGICEREMLAVEYIRKNHPRLANLPIINDECDPQVGWRDTHSWHATSYVAAIMTKIIDQHQRIMIDKEKVPYAMLANDNGFLGSWGHRTQMTYYGNKSYTKAQSEWVSDLTGLDNVAKEPLAFIKKPSLAVMEFLGLLGNERLEVNAEPPLAPDTDGLGTIATRHADGRLAVVIYNSVDPIRVSGMAPVKFDLSLPAGTHDYAVYTIEGDAAFAVWEKLAAPNSPTDEQLAEMRAAAEPVLAQSGEALGKLSLDLSVPLPSVYLVVTAPRDSAAPPAPTIVSQEAYVTPGGGTEILLRWACAAPLTTYEVAVAGDRNGPFSPVYEGLLANAAMVPLSNGAKCISVKAKKLSGKVSEPVLVQL